jgi:outer membrane biosynthesis protein TonB
MKPFLIVDRNQLRTATGIGISLLLHALLLLFFRTQMPKPAETSGSESRAPLVVELNRQPLGRKTAPPPAAAPAPAIKPQPARPQPTPRLRADKPAVKRQAAPRLPAPPRAVVPPRLAEAPRAVPEPPAPPAPEKAAPPADMSEMVAAARARRRAAGIPSPDETTGEQDARPQGDEVARANVARSIAQARGRSGAGGVFQITHKGTREASFLFRGWDNDSRAGLREMVEVDAGPNGNVEDAIVRKMIEIIRKHQPADFSWNSRRLGRVVTLSARREDNAGLEDFLKKEFF